MAHNASFCFLQANHTSNTHLWDFLADRLHTADLGVFFTFNNPNLVVTASLASKMELLNAWLVVMIAHSTATLTPLLEISTMVGSHDISCNHDVVVGGR